MFAARIEQLRRECRREELAILVWGPGDPGPRGDQERRRVWEKRLQIKETLQREFPNAEIALSEDIQLRQLTSDLDDLLSEELAHAASADCILVLDLSRGAHVEVDRFTMYPALAAKMWLLLPDRFVGTAGLISVVHEGLKVRGFSPQEFEACSVARELAVKIVLSVAMHKRLRRYS